MNVAIAVFVGAALGLAGAIGGVSAYQVSGDSNTDLKLYSYADK